jgi:hypothetical protein
MKYFAPIHPPWIGIEKIYLKNNCFLYNQFPIVEGKKMNLDEARKVLWLKNNHRPLGELLDEGFLNQSRLEWAAKSAYDPDLKQAAKVILERKNHLPTSTEIEKKPTGVLPIDLDSSLVIGITLDKARSTLWPFPPHKGQLMGDLVESHQLSLKDLGYALESAWEKKVRQAATALMLLRLGQIVREPDPPAGFVQINSGGRSYSESKQLQLTFIEGLFIGGLIVLMAGATIWELARYFSPHPNVKFSIDSIQSFSGIIILVLLLAFAALIIWLVVFIPDQITKRLDKMIEMHRLGQEGEERTVQSIIQSLDGNWTLFRNIKLPSRNKGDLDIILVGSPGVWVLEVKNFNGEYRNIGETWEYRHGNRWKTADVNPSRQAIRNAVRLRNFLQADNINVFVNAVVVWANEERSLIVENPTTSIWLFNHLSDELGNIMQAEKISGVERKKIAEKLNKLCESKKLENRR